MVNCPLNFSSVILFLKNIYASDVMKQLVIIVFLCISGIFFSQIKNYRKQIDSIANASWNQKQPNLDSLQNPVFEVVIIKKSDTILLKDKKILSVPNSDLPITPYLVIKNSDLRNWFLFGSNNLIINQSSFSNWNSGGNNNLGVLAKINYTLTYKSRKHFVENNLQTGYGFVASAGQSSRKTEDFLNFMTNYGYDLGKNKYLSAGFQFISQITPGYNYTLTPDPVFQDRISKFLGPAYVNIGVGISYNPNENFQVIVRPINGKFTIVTDPLLQKNGKYGLEFDGQKVRKELGARVNFMYDKKFMTTSVW